MSEDHLLEIFGCYGKVLSATVDYHYHTTISKGRAVVVMETIEDAKKAIEGLNNGQIDGIGCRCGVYV